MSSVIAVVSEPTRRINFPSNCEIQYSQNVLLMRDDAAPKEFEQRAQFDSIAPQFESFLARIPVTGNFRIISFCTEFSIFNTASIKDYCLKMARIRFPQNSKTSQFVAIGFVYDSSVRDFLSLEDVETDQFELIETFDTAEALDLLECGLEKLRRIKDSVFVLHIGTDNSFFEWVIIPKTDSYIPSPSMAGLPPNEKFFFILNQLPTLTNPQFERFRRLSSILRLVADSFADVPTWFSFHVADEVTMKSNATLVKVAGMLMNSKNVKFTCYKTDMFYVASKENMSFSSGASDDYLASLTAEELAEVEYLKSMIKGGSPKSQKGKGGFGFNGNAFFSDEEDQYEYEYEYEEVQGEDGILRRPRRKRKLQKKTPTKTPEKTPSELAAEEEERRRREEEEEEERRRAVEMVRRARSPKASEAGQQEQKKKGWRSARSILESSQISKMSRRDKVSERIKRLRELRAMEEEEEEEDYEDSSELYESRYKNLTPEERYRREMQRKFKERHAKFTKISILVNDARRAAKNKAISLQELEDLQKRVDEALAEAREFREEAKDEIDYLRDTLAYRKQKHAQNQADIKEIRNVYLERHCENVQEMNRRKKMDAKLKADIEKQQEEDEQQSGKTKRGAERVISITNRSPEYEMAVKYLEEEIDKITSDIQILRRRQPVPAAA